MRARRVEELAARILSIASRDVFGGVGRVLIPELEVEGYSYDEVIEALNMLRDEGYEVSVVGDVIKVKLRAR
ncbi:MAG: hypothetical protein QW407_05770 [Thermofilaceae archaeon]